MIVGDNRIQQGIVVCNNLRPMAIYSWMNKPIISAIDFHNNAYHAIYSRCPIISGRLCKAVFNFPIYPITLLHVRRNMHLENCPTLLCVNDIWRFRTAGHTASFSHHFSISHAGVSPPAWGTRTQTRSPRIHHCLHAEQIMDLPLTGGSRRLLYPACCRGPPPTFVLHFQILEEKKCIQRTTAAAKTT